MDSMYTVKLTASECCLLDGRVNAVAQAEVEKAKIAASLADVPDWAAKMAADIVAEAQKNGRLIHQQTLVRSCPCCHHSEGYRRYTRNGRYHRKGEADTSSPIMFYAWNVAHRFVTIKNYIYLGYCGKCADVMTPLLRRVLASVKAEIPASLTGAQQVWQRYDNRQCTACGWEGHEGQMGQLRAFMSDGSYPGKCPSCGAEDRIFSQKIKRVDGFTLVELRRGVRPEEGRG